jgi:YD repeat-containing protein
VTVYIYLRPGIPSALGKYILSLFHRGGATLKYNAFGQRQSQTVTGGGTHFLFGADGALLAEHNVQGGLVRNYVYLNGRPLAVVDGTGAVSYILTDHLGQPQKMLNASGAVIRVIHPDTSFFTYEVDGLGRPTVVREFGGAPVAAFAYDAAGRRVTSGWAVGSYASPS